MFIASYEKFFMIDFILQPISLLLIGTAYFSYMHDRNAQIEADNIQRNLEHLLNTFDEYERNRPNSTINENNLSEDERYLLGSIIDDEDLKKMKKKDNEKE